MGGCNIQATGTFKFLGTHFDDRLRWNCQIENLEAKLRRNSGLVRLLGAFMTKEERRILYFGLVQGVLLSGAEGYFAELSAAQVDTLQVACNTGVRAVVGIPTRGQQPMTQLRSLMRIPSVKMLQEEIVQIAAWSRKGLFQEEIEGRLRTTRFSEEGKVTIPALVNQRSSEFVERTAWNAMSVLERSISTLKDFKNNLRKVRNSKFQLKLTC